MRLRKQKKSSIVKDAVRGAVAGAVATAAMGPAYSRLHALERDSAKAREKEVSPDLTSTQLLATKLAKAFGVTLSEKQRGVGAQVVHWSYGIGWGALFGVLHERVPVPRWLHGLIFGTLVGVIGQAALLPAFKLAPPPQKYPVDTSLVGWGAHLVYGAAAEGTLVALRRALA